MAMIELALLARSGHAWTCGFDPLVRS